VLGTELKPVNNGKGQCVSTALAALSMQTFARHACLEGT